MFGERLTILALIAFGAVAISTASGQSAHMPRFDAYPSEMTPTSGKDAPLQLKSPFVRTFRTRLLACAKQPPNFAGRYRVVQWGCGTSCVTGAVIDQRAGRVVPLPFTICCSAVHDDGFRAINFRQDSRLIVFTGLRNEEGAEGAHFYTFDGHRFTFITTVIGIGATPDSPIR